MPRQALGNLGRSHSAGKHACIVLATEARESPYTQDRAGSLSAVSGHYHEDMMATYLSRFAGETAGKWASQARTQ